MTIGRGQPHHSAAPNKGLEPTLDSAAQARRYAQWSEVA